jgi:hypothetical protein
MKNKYKIKKCAHGTKKIKKAVNGLQIIDDKGGLTGGASQIGGTVAGLGAGLLEGATQSKYDNRYTSQLKDSNQATGRAIGAGAGFALNAVVPGLGTIASPLLSTAGGAIQRGLQGNKLEGLKQEGERQDKIEKLNEGVGKDLTSFQTKQYKSGGTVKPYRAKNAKDYKIRKQAYADSLDLYNKGEAKINQLKEAATSVGANPKVILDEEYNIEGKKNFISNYGGKIAPARNLAIKADYKGDVPGGAWLTKSAVQYDKPKQEVLPPAKQFTPNKTVPKLATKNSTLESNSEKLNIPEKIEQPKPKGYKRVFKPSNQPGYKQFREYGKYEMEPQYSKGTKVIEIEGKETPEIHTDKNFNVKNLGTTPHSKGGDKVLAEGGDIVFPTQNSPKKYNEIMNAIMKKDKYKLKKEQSKLPEDKVSKARFGMQVTGEEEDHATAADLAGHRYPNAQNMSPYKKPLTVAPGVNVDVTAYGKGSAKGKRRATPTIDAESIKFKAPKDNGPVDLSELEKIDNNNARSRSILGNTTNYSNNPDVNAESDDVSTKSDSTGNKKSKFDLNNMAELAPIGYNLGQGLFGKPEKVKRRNYNPNLEQYVDTSQTTRREADSLYKGALSNSRNLSGGSVANARANNQVAANAKFNAVNQIDSQEFGKQVDINNRNTNTLNNAKLTNLELDNKYDEIDSMNQAKKQEALSQGLTELGQLGSRNKSEKNELNAHKHAWNMLSKGNYKVDVNEAGESQDIAFNGGSVSALSTPGLTGANYNAGRKRNSSGRLGVTPNSMFSVPVEKKAKGTKGINVNRKYKLK